MTTVADHLLERLAAGGRAAHLRYPGDGILGIMGALNRAGGGIDGPGSLELVQARHEEMAAFMACAHAKFTGEVGVCLATSGPGAIHLLNGLYDAKLDHQPVVAIVGQQARTALGGSYMRLGIGRSEPWEAEDAFPLDPVPDVRERGLDHPSERTR